MSNFQDRLTNVAAEVSSLQHKFEAHCQDFSESQRSCAKISAEVASANDAVSKLSSLHDRVKATERSAEALHTKMHSTTQQINSILEGLARQTPPDKVEKRLAELEAKLRSLSEASQNLEARQQDGLGSHLRDVSNMVDSLTAWKQEADGRINRCCLLSAHQHTRRLLEELREDVSAVQHETGLATRFIEWYTKRGRVYETNADIIERQLIGTLPKGLQAFDAEAESHSVSTYSKSVPRSSP